MNLEEKSTLLKELERWKTYCKILGINKYASKQDIKIAYKKLARKYHPDLNNAPDAQERFLEIHRAYSELMNSDIEKIKSYLKMTSMNKAIESMNKAITKLTESLKQDTEPINEESRRFFI